jgi:hypothetical protein
VVTPTPASANAANSRKIEATGRYDGVTPRDVVVDGEMTDDSGNAGLDDEKSIGISVSEDGASASDETAAFVVFRLRGLYARERWGPVLGLLGWCRAMMEAIVSSAIGTALFGCGGRHGGMVRT